MPKQITLGEYVTVYLNGKNQVLVPPVSNCLVVKTNFRSLDVQTPDDNVLRVLPKQLKEPAREDPGPAEFFLTNLTKIMKHYGNPNPPSLSRKWLKEQFSQTKKNYLVEDIYVTKKGNVVVKTRSLPTYDWDGKKLRHKVGRMAIKIESRNCGSEEVSVKNLDWGIEDLDHPHVEDTWVCLGEAKHLMWKVWPRGDIASIIEIMLAMLTQFDMNDSEYPEWLKLRTKRRGESKEFMEEKARIKWN